MAHRVHLYNSRADVCPLCGQELVRTERTTLPVSLGTACACSLPREDGPGTLTVVDVLLWFAAMCASTMTLDG